MKPKPILFLTTACLMVIAVILVIQGAKEQRKNLQALIQQTFNQVIEEDLEKRFSESGASFTALAQPNTNRTKGLSIIIDIDGKRFVAEETPLNELFFKKLRQFQQTVLVDSKPINIVVLNTMFREQLSKKNIPARTTVILNEGKAQERASSSTDSYVYGSSVKAGPINIDLYKDIRVTGYALVPWWYLAWQILPQTSSSLLLSAVLISFALCLFLRMKANSKKNSSTPPSESDTSNESYRLGQLSINKTTKSLLAGTMPVRVSERDYRLLLLFLSSPYHYLSRESIVQQFWSEKEDCTDRINTSISRLRKILKEADPDLKIITEKKAGYRLITKAQQAKCNDESCVY